MRVSTPCRFSALLDHSARMNITFVSPVVFEDKSKTLESKQEVGIGRLREAQP